MRQQAAAHNKHADKSQSVKNEYQVKFCCLAVLVSVVAGNTATSLQTTQQPDIWTCKVKGCRRHLELGMANLHCTAGKLAVRLQ